METELLSPYYDAITECEGSFRDLNFKPANVAAAEGVFDLFSTLFVLSDAHDEEGNELLDIATIYFQVENKQTGMIHACWTGEKKWVTQIQIFMDWDAPDFNCEISFYPDDIDKSIFTAQLFTEFLENLLKIADTEEYYLRYENASWRFGEYKENSGIIFSHKEIPL